MEPLVLFAGFVGAIGLMHLLTNTVSLLKRWFGGAQTGKTVVRNKVKRDDWYVFFDWNDLVGRDAQKKSTANRSDDTTGVQDHVVSKKQRRSPQRPSLRLSLQ